MISRKHPHKTHDVFIVYVMAITSQAYLPLIQGISGGMVNTLGGGSMDFSE